MLCRTCGNDIPAGKRFCRQCGAPAEESTQPETPANVSIPDVAQLAPAATPAEETATVCPSCSADVPVGKKFCARSGSSQNVSGAVAVNPITEISVGIDTNNSSHYVLIKHTAGSRVNEIDKFAIEGFKDVTVGRSERVNVRYNPQTDDLVSREHLRITQLGHGSDEFVICDLQSLNGTFVNGSRIQGTCPIRHNDVVRLGTNGPEFRFEIVPALADSLGNEV